MFVYLSSLSFFSLSLLLLSSLLHSFILSFFSLSFSFCLSLLLFFLSFILFLYSLFTYNHSNKVRSPTPPRSTRNIFESVAALNLPSIKGYEEELAATTTIIDTSLLRLDLWKKSLESPFEYQLSNFLCTLFLAKLDGVWGLLAINNQEGMFKLFFYLSPPPSRKAKKSQLLPQYCLTLKSSGQRHQNSFVSTTNIFKTRQDVAKLSWFRSPF